MHCRVVALSMSPVDDTFISGSLDKTIRLWDLRSPNCQVMLPHSYTLSVFCGKHYHQCSLSRKGESSISFLGSQSL